MPVGTRRARSPRSAPRQPRLLVVEDHPDIAALLRVVFDVGWDVECVGTLREAREALVRRPAYDVLLVDVQLPDGDGTSLCREAKQAVPALRVVILSHPPARTEALAAGADLFFPKPFDPEALEAEVEALLETRLPG